LWKNALSQSAEKSFKNALEPEADDFQNLISSSFYTDTYTVKF